MFLLHTLHDLNFRVKFVFLFPLFFLVFHGMMAQNPHGEKLKLDCKECHTTGTWSYIGESAGFDHSMTGFLLEGSHQSVTCVDCHTSLSFEKVGSDCISCHQDVHSMSVGNDCSRCHFSTSWAVENIPELHEQNGFPLNGQHQVISCESCHISETGLRFDRIGNDCFTCHQEDYISTDNPSHQNLGISMECTNCHYTDTWQGAEFTDHDFFPLAGGHAINECAACHDLNNFAAASPECITCHQDDYNNADNPNHQNLGISQDCTNCHSTDTWQVAEFTDHGFFPLTGGHAINDCAACHDLNNYATASPECITCHQDDYNNADNPNHQNLGISQDCTNCHSTDTWQGAEFTDHNFFPLTGGHAINDCAACHDLNNYAAASPECITCHQDDYNNADNPNHQTLGISQDCTNCHSTDTWQGAEFTDHGFFPLTGGHAINDCAACHDLNNYAAASPKCITCHQDDYNNADNPNHQNLGISQDCTNCHSTDTWQGAEFNDHGFFPLTSGHAINDCAACHDLNNFAAASPECITCHQDDYNNADNPNHQTLGISQDCTNCHSTDTWQGAEFTDHDFFPLTGGHAINDCAACHDLNNFAAASPECITCHQDDYNRPSDPDHNTPGFSTDCILCHTVQDWSPASFISHDDEYFPIYSGNHREEWNSCLECHTSTGTYTAFSCIDCHEHSNAFEMARNHDEVGGFAFESNACYSCHPNGEGD